jgi:GMP synthase (glutamine-hydrolysing)
MTVRPILCIRNEPADTLGIVPQVFHGNDVPVMILDAFDATSRWPSLGDVSGLVVFGGEMNADEVDRYPYLLQERRLLREAVNHEVPTLGLCLGSQLLSRTLGGRVTRAPVREFGFSRVRLTRSGRKDPLLSAFPPVTQVFEWHEDTFDLPSGGTLLAEGDRVRAQAFRVGRRAWGFQFHLEVDEPDLEVAFEELGSAFWGRSLDDVRREVKEHLAVQVEIAQEVLQRFAQEAIGESRRPR